MTISDFGMDETKIWLIRDDKRSKDNYLSFSLLADDPDGDGEAFAPIAYTAIELLGQNHVVLYGAPYKLLKEAKKRIFGGWRKPKFSDKDAASCLRKYLGESGWHDGLFADREYSYMEKVLWSKCRHDHKRLFILQQQLDMELFKKTDQTYLYNSGFFGVEITVFPDTQIKMYGSEEETIDHYWQTDDFIMEFEALIASPCAYITLNTQYMSVQQLIEQLRIVVAKYNKTLEVEI